MAHKLIQHTTVGFLSLLLFFLAKYNHPIHSTWRALGDVSFILLAITLMIGPLSRLWVPASKLLPWRRVLGIWFFLIAVLHVVLIFDGWFEWDIMRSLGYQLDGRHYILSKPGFGLANLIGFVGFLFAFILTATSFDKIIKSLGGKAWKWIQNFAHVIFYLIAFHSIYFLFFHFANKKDLLSWFGSFSLILIFLVIFLQTIAFIKTVNANKNSK